MTDTATMDAILRLAMGYFGTALDHHRAGRLAQAAAHYQLTLALAPDSAESLSNLGLVLQGLGQLPAAAAACRRAIAAKPAFAEAHNNLANALAALGQTEDAETRYRFALALRPDYAEACYNLGNTLYRLGRAEDAAANYGRALALKPGYAEAQGNLGLALLGLGRLAEAETRFRAALDRHPGNAGFHTGLGTALHQQGRRGEAEACFRRALKHAPDHQEALNGLGTILVASDRMDEAEECFRRVLAHDPDHEGARGNLGTILMFTGRLDEAEVCFHRVLEANSGAVDFHRNLLLLALYQHGRSPDDFFALHRRFEERHARPHYARIQPHANRADPHRRLRIGYLSSDLREHSVARNLLPVLRRHDRSRFGLYFYAELTQPDAVTAEFQSLAEGWHKISGRSDAEVAEMIRADGIDILVCLAGRFDRNRPLVAAFKPAPLQISWYDGATSGLEVMDYLLSDRVMTPRDGSERFTERLLCLPRFYVAEPPKALPAIMPRTGPVVFGSLNNPAKLTGPVLALWARLLHRVPDSRLLLKYRNWYEQGPLRDRIIATFARHGIAPDRLICSGRLTSTAQHLDLYNQIDIALDPFPFSGSTATFEALLMGVPVVTLAGETMMSRWSAAMLAGLDLQTLAACSPAAYLDTAARIAADGDLRAAMRAGLRDRVIASPLCDGGRKARQIERFYRAVWRRWCASRPDGKPAP